MNQFSLFNQFMRSLPNYSFNDSGSTLPTRICYDISYTISSGRTSGIERVVRNLRVGLADICSDRRIEFVPIIAFNRTFYEVDTKSESDFKKLTAWNLDIVRQMPAWYAKVFAFLVKTTGSKKLKRWFLPDRGHMGIFKIYSEIYERILRRRMVHHRHSMRFSNSDLIIMPDAYWTEMQALEAGSAARDQGASVVAVVYDLIPLTHPEMVGESRSNDFGKYIQRLLEVSNTIVAISKTVAKQTCEIASNRTSSVRQHDIPCKDVRHFRLGCDLPKVACESEIRSELKTVFSPSQIQKMYLMVSTFDPRKNHVYAIDNFEHLWEQGIDVSLCLVGRVGWLCKDVVERIQKHSERSRRLFIFHDLSDAELQFAYKNARAALMPSVAEGFGLPIAEAMFFGCPVFASDIEVHREVGENNCEYFDLKDRFALATTVMNDRQLPTETTIDNQRIQQSHVDRLIYSWRDSSKEFFDVVIEAHRDRTAIQSEIRRAA